MGKRKKSAPRNFISEKMGQLLSQVREINKTREEDQEMDRKKCFKEAFAYSKTLIDFKEKANVEKLSTSSADYLKFLRHCKENYGNAIFYTIKWGTQPGEEYQDIFNFVQSELNQELERINTGSIQKNSTNRKTELVKSMGNLPFNYQKKMTLYTNIVKDRGYTFFDKKSYEAYVKKYGNRSMGDVYDDIENEIQYNIERITHPMHPDHTRAYNEYKNRYGGNMQTMRDAVKQKHYEKNGRLQEQRPNKNSAYEARVLTKPKYADTLAGNEIYKALCNLMRAKWNAIGYAGDEELKKEFEDHYAAAQY